LYCNTAPVFPTKKKHDKRRAEATNHCSAPSSASGSGTGGLMASSALGYGSGGRKGLPQGLAENLTQHDKWKLFEYGM
jgi:hypothetical protein